MAVGPWPGLPLARRGSIHAARPAFPVGRPQDALEQFAAGVARQGVDEVDALGALVVRQPLAHPVDDVAVGVGQQAAQGPESGVRPGWRHRSGALPQVAGARSQLQTHVCHPNDITNAILAGPAQHALAFKVQLRQRNP